MDQDPDKQRSEADAEIERSGEVYRAEDVHSWARKIAQRVASPRPRPWRK